jgi:hypothetical protein
MPPICTLHFKQNVLATNATTGITEIDSFQRKYPQIPAFGSEKVRASGLGQSKMRVELDSYDGLPVRRCQPISTDWKSVVPKK